MKRDILFKGKREDKEFKDGKVCKVLNEWVYGSLKDWLDGDFSIIVRELKELREFQFLVDPKTVGQFSGLADKNSVKMFGGDIFKYSKHDGYLLPDFVAVVVWLNDKACFGYKIGAYTLDFSCHDELQNDLLNYCEVIGNIHDNPELLNTSIKSHE